MKILLISLLWQHSFSAIGFLLRGSKYFSMTYNSCLVTLVALFLVQLHESCSYLQELNLFEDYQGTTLVHSYHTGVPDYDQDKAKRVRRFCQRGMWVKYFTKNYGSGNVYGSDREECYNTTNGGWLSFRPLAAEDTDVEAISLYQNGLYGAETLIVQPAYAGLTHSKTGGIAITGKSGWLAFEGQNFNGTSSCYQRSASWPHAVTFWHSVESSGLAGIGSILKGCQRTLTTEYLEKVRKDWADQLKSSA